VKWRKAEHEMNGEESNGVIIMAAAMARAGIKANLQANISCLAES
jgi:hypothetical protein